MDKKIAGLLGAAAALTAVTAAHAAVPAQPEGYAPAASYRDLLDPVPNAVSALKADDARVAEAPVDSVKDDGLQVAQFYHHHHHHHHHHHVVPRPLRRLLHGHHHHHHHHHHH
jgi:hypothetical protein